MSHPQQSQTMLSGAQFKEALNGGFKKFAPKLLAKNPVMLVVSIGSLVTLYISLANAATGRPFLYEGSVTLILIFTVWFANVAESIAEARGKAQAKSLRSAREGTQARRLTGQVEQQVSSLDLRKGDLVVIEAGGIIPGDGEVVEGIASVDESAITGESAPVIREAGSDFSGVTGGTRVLSDRIVVRIGSNPGESFLDRMIQLVEGASRQKTPNEIALGILLSALTIVFLMVVVTLPAIAGFVGVKVDVTTLVALLVCLIPTTIGGLLPAIGIAGMDRALKANVIAKSGKAVEVAGDVDTLLLDKTGTITYGNRRATEFIAVQNKHSKTLIEAALLSSLSDQTPEGKSIVTLARSSGMQVDERLMEGAEFIEFTAQTRMSGVNLPDGRQIRKGSSDRIVKFAHEHGIVIPTDLHTHVEHIARMGSTPLVVVQDSEILGVVALSDVVKTGMRERFAELRRMGLRTVMVTGDNPLTAQAIAKEAGVDAFIAEATPEDKLKLIREEQAQGKRVAMMGDGTNDAPALAQADVGLAMNSGTPAAKEAGNMIDLDNDPTKLLEIIAIGKGLLITRGALTTFSIANDVAKYFAILPALFVTSIPELKVLDVMGLGTPQSAILSAVIFNALIIPALIPVALKGVKYTPASSDSLLARNLLIYGLGGVLLPFLGIKLIDLVLALMGWN
ncbi:MAG: potassium-transporting ATPase subunit KdpB [Deinococcaceae bacterium]